MKNVEYKRYPIGNKRFLWKQKEFMLSTFSCCAHGGVMPEEGYAEIVDKSVKHLKEAGFNLLELGWVGHDSCFAAVDACEKYEIDLLFQDMTIMGGMQHHCLDNKVGYDVVLDLTSKLKPKKHTIGYYVWDEPHTAEQLAEARRQMDMLQKADPEALLFTVAIPDYNKLDDEIGYSWENGKYASYVERFANEMDPPVLSVDYYPVGDYFDAWPGHKFNPENQLDDTFMWLDMALYRKVGKERNIPFWFYYQGYKLYKCTDYFIFPMVRCFMYAAIMYGAKGLQNYTAWCDAVIDKNGDKAKYFEDQKKIHSEIKNLAKTLMALDSKLIYHSKDLLPGCEYTKGYFNSIEESPIFKGELPKRVSVGELEDDYGNRYAVVLNRDYENDAEFTLDLKENLRIYEVSKEDGKHNVMFDNADRLPLSLKAGDAIVLRVQKPSEEAFSIDYVLEEK